MPFISQLNIYPIKSLGGIAVSSSIITSRGLQYDRRYMLVDKDNLFITQREHPELALFRTAIDGDELSVYHKNNASEKLHLSLVPDSSDAIVTVKVWDDLCEALYVSEKADSWFSEKLNFSCRLVYMPESTKRRVDPLYAINDEITSFSDGYPILLIGQSSLDDLNGRIGEPLPMNRFRPNIVMAGGQPFEEDTMGRFMINGINFYGVKLCGRCVVTTTNQETSITGKEPLKALAKYRMYNNKVLFGQNVLCSGNGMISVGDEVIVLKNCHSPL